MIVVINNPLINTALNYFFVCVYFSQQKKSKSSKPSKSEKEKEPRKGKGKTSKK